MARRERARVNTGTYTSCAAELVVVVVVDVVVVGCVIGSSTVLTRVSADTCKGNIVCTVIQFFNKSDVKPDVMIKKKKKIGIVMFLFRKLVSLCVALYLH